MSERRPLGIVAVFCTVMGLLGWVFYANVFKHEFGEDWMVYDNAVRAYFEGNLALVYDGERSTALLNARFADWLATPLPLHPWLYPPHFLLLLLPFGLPPFAVSGALFLGASFAALLAAAWRHARSGEERAIYALSLLLCPASAITVCLGQNTFLTGALLIAGMGLAPRRPVLSGLLLGILTYKPQLWLLVPVALAAQRHWKALAATCATALLLCLLSAAVLGSGPWRDWLALMTQPSALYDQWRVLARLNGQSVYADASLIGASETVANLVQALAALAAASCVWWCYRRPMGCDLRLAVLLAATMLSAPHVIGYDAVMLGIAATVFFVHGMRHGLALGDAAIAMLVWTSPLINPPSVFRLGLVTPLLIALFIAWVMARGRSDAIGPALGVTSLATQ
jgi:alpha-1,2-mannosyltransferase